MDRFRSGLAPELLKILNMLAEGMSVERIANHFGTSELSIKTMKKRIMASLKVKTLEEAITYWKNHQQTLKRETKKIKGSVSWYRYCFLNSQFDVAIAEWSRTEAKYRNSKVRLIICLMLTLLKRDLRAEEESTFLLAEDGNDFVQFAAWLRGEQAALKMLKESLKQAPKNRRHMMMLAIYYGSVLAKDYAEASNISSELHQQLQPAPIRSHASGLAE